MKSFYICMISMFLGWSAWAQTSIYYMGMENLPFSSPLPCYVEAQFSADLISVAVRAIAPHPHEAGYTAFAMGPVTAAYDSNGKYYRFQNPDSAAPIKDMLLNAEVPGDITKYGVLILHGNHHDPLFCENLSEATGVDVPVIIDLFKNFEFFKNENL